MNAYRAVLLVCAVTGAVAAVYLAAAEYRRPPASVEVKLVSPTEQSERQILDILAKPPPAR